MADHALFSPSGAHRWVPCPGSLILTKDLPRTSSSYADEGTAAHTLAAKTLASKTKKTENFLNAMDDETGYKYDAEMCNYVQTYVDTVLDYAQDGELLIEQRVDFSTPIGAEPDTAFGTSDVIILHENELTIVDLKYGRGVAVSAVNNPQLKLYAIGALHQYGMIIPIERVRMVIVQPRTSSVVSESVMTVAELEADLETFYKAVVKINRLLENPNDNLTAYLSVGEKQCRFCGVKASCPALAAHVQEELSQDFADFDDLICDEPSPEALDLVEDWIRAKRADIERRLFANEPLTMWKLVEGKKGNRQWCSQDEAEKTMKAMRLKADDMYTRSLITAPQAEKLLKKTQPRRWAKLQSLIVQSGGKASVAPMADPRPAISVKITADEFDGLDLTSVNTQES